MDVEKAIREYLPNIIHMSLATCVDNKPWVCEVRFAYDDDLNLYWRSVPTARHSQEIVQNPNVAGNVAEQHSLDMKLRGVYFEGSAVMLTGVTQEDAAYKLYADRFGLGPEMIEQAARPDGLQFYKLTVADWYMFDMRESMPPQKYHLEH